MTTQGPVSLSTDPASQPQLTRREHEVVRLVTQGMSSKDIASTLVVAPRTAESHIENILTKLGFTSRAQIGAWMAEGRARRSV